MAGNVVSDRNEIIIDCGLNLCGGHHASHLRCVIASLRGNGTKIYCILTNRNVSKASLDEVPVCPIFEYTGYEGCSQRARNEEKVEHLDLAAAHNIALRLLGQEAALERATALRILNATTAVVLGTALWLRLRGRPFGGQIMIYMITGPGIRLRPVGSKLRLVEVNEQRRKALVEAFSTIQQGSHCFELRATSLLRAFELRSLTKQSVMPYTLVTEANLEPVKFAPAALPRILLYAGDAKVEKGLGRLPALVSSLLDMASENRIKLEIAMHIHDQDGQFSFLVQRLLATTLSSNGITLFRGRLDPTAYRELLAQSHVVVLLHTQEGYHDMESGLANECIAAGIPVLCQQETLTGRQLLMYGGSRFCFKNYSEISTKVHQFILDATVVRANAAKIAERVRRQAMGWPVI